MRILRNKATWILLTVVAALVLGALPASAHERREIGDYQVVVGFIVEPAFVGEKNGVDFRVTRVADSEPVEGVEDTVQVEVTYVPGDQSRTFDLRTIFGDPGHYTADLIATSPGHYRMRFFGNIEGMEIDETFESRSGGGNFNDMATTVDIQFPEPLPEVREIEAAVRGNQTAIMSAQDSAMAANNSASSARVLGIAGVIVGAVGIGVGGAAIVTRRK
jgi:hypothetical protein